MKSLSPSIRTFLVCASLLGYSASALADEKTLDVYKSPTCGCCTKWVEYMEGKDFKLTTHEVNDIMKFKGEKGIKSQYASCHTAFSPEGYLFEGHIPSDLIEKFLSDTPKDAIGLSVPGMPLGSPGMEYDNRVAPHQVLLLKKDGTHEVYAEITKPHSK